MNKIDPQVDDMEDIQQNIRMLEDISEEGWNSKKNTPLKNASITDTFIDRRIGQPLP